MRPGRIGRGALKGVWYGCKHAIPALRRAGGGSVINTASFVGLLGAATPQLACTDLTVKLKQQSGAY